MKTLKVKALAGLLALLLPNFAALAETSSLKPYNAEYKTSALGMSITLKRELVQSATGEYLLKNGGKTFVAGFEESSQFTIKNGQIESIAYDYVGSGLINRERQTLFTPGSDTLRSLYKEKWYDLPSTAATLDRLNQQEQARLDLLNADSLEKTIKLTVADGKRIKEYELSFVAKEKLVTELGEIDTLRFERIHSSKDRKSDIWFAVDWDYLIVKTLHIEDGKPIELNISKASIDGVEVGSGS